MHRLTEKNIDRLREWEPWAQGEQSEPGQAAFTRVQLDRFVRGEVVPTVILRGGEPIGSASLTLDEYLANAELGYWIDRHEEGRGIVSRACSALIEHAAELGIRRVEIRTAERNRRSCRVAERLGFAREGLLRQALPIGESRLDVALYGLLV
ncbi:GNAT family N-acetyltransferase [Herbiconiux sp. A18JL235]|uniref:GNAT family N-acetyltransferase n=1 Tax=Herbiconiux sp. A18JL235 TaxID=3152363 RepID=A0AB39BDD2_9MICO